MSNFPDVIYESIVSLLVQKFPDGLSEQEIDKFVKQCYDAHEIYKVSRNVHRPKSEREQQPERN